MGEKFMNTKVKEVVTTKKEFFKGDLAVYPAHGVGCIESIEQGDKW